MVKKRERSAIAEDANIGSTSALACGGHDYIQEGNSTCFSEEDFPQLPLTPSKSPAPKKKTQDAVATSPNCDISAQLANITQLINNRSDNIEGKISDLNNKVEAMADDLRAVTTKMAILEKRVDSLEQPIRKVQRRMDELKSYTRRWNLKLMGVPESENENTRLAVTKICQAVLTSMREKHRLKRQANNNNIGPRAIILQFVSRVCRDAIWKAAKVSPYLKDRGLEFKEDFSKGDRERRRRLWPEVQKAREAGKVAYYAVARAFIQGEGEIILSDQ